MKKRLYQTGAIAIAVLVVGLMAPRAARAVAATLVQVVNTTANPVPNMDVERASRTPYQSSTQQACSNPTCNFFFTAAPAGKRLVVQNVAGYHNLAPGANALFASLTDGLSLSLGLPGLVGPNDFGNIVPSGFNQNVTAYFDAGAQPEVQVFSSFVSGFYQSVTVTGYLENCAVTGCPAVQH